LQDTLCNKIDASKFPSINALNNAVGTEAMPETEAAGEMIAKAFDQLSRYPSGSFVDLRKM
jgi:hypothetical protein